jgi:4-amino-4-deoxy-L-arabinose transferase-like glycosyltransferase
MPGSIERLLSTRRPFLLLTVLCLLLWLPGFFNLPPTDRDESRFVQATRQMLESGDFVSIQNGTTARNQKPIGIYWLQLPAAAAARALGLARENPVWPYRLPSLLGGILGVCATYAVGRRLLGHRVAMLGASMLGASMVLAVETHIAKTDAALLAATTVAMAGLAAAYLGPLPRWGWLGFWLALGVGILIKGPVTPMVVALTAAALAIADAKRASPRWLLRLRPALGVLVMLAVTLPWFIAIGVRTGGAFFEQSLGADLADKVAGGDDGHGGWPGWHLLLLSMTLFPSGCVALPALPAAWRARRLPAMRFLLAWAIPSWLVFEAVPTKLPHYTLPLLPALCLLGAAWALDRRPTPVWLQRVTLGLSVAAAAVFGLGAAALPAVIGVGETWSALLGAPALLAAGVIAWMLLRRGFLAALMAVPLLIWSVIGLELPLLPQLWIAPRVAMLLEQNWPGGIAFAAAGFAEPSLVFLCGTDTKLLANGRDGARFLAAGGPHAVLVDGRDTVDFMGEAKALAQAPRLVAEIDGFNYSNGRRVKLRLFANASSKSQ